MKSTLSLTKFYVVAAALGLPLAAHAQHIGFGLRIGIPAPVYVRAAPPPVVYESVTVAPGPGYYWVAGHYSWQGGQWVWIRGAWVMPPQQGAFWVAGRYEGQNWIESHWEVTQGPPPPPPGVVVEAAPGGQVIYADTPPPPLQQETIVYASRPGPDYVWIGGYWGWEHGRRTWVGGRWDHPPRRGAVWIAPRWDHHDGRYVFVRGYWR